MPPSPEMPDVEIRQLDGGYFMGEFRQIDGYFFPFRRGGMDQAITGESACKQESQGNEQTLSEGKDQMDQVHHQQDQQQNDKNGKQVAEKKDSYMHQRAYRCLGSREEHRIKAAEQRNGEPGGPPSSPSSQHPGHPGCYVPDATAQNKETQE